MERVGSSKWVEYVFEDDEEQPESEVDGDDVEEEFEEEPDFHYGTDCIINQDDIHDKQWVPRCPKKLLPKVGMIFESLEDGQSFYREYTSVVGFDVRISTTHKFPRSDLISSRYLRCNRHGYKNTSNSNGIRKTSSDRVGCDAWICFKYSSGGKYKVSKINEGHLHDMIPKYARHLLKSNRKMEIGHKKFMLSCAKANIGPNGAHKLMEELVGVFWNLRATARDFRNYKRDLMENISDADAQMAINMLKRKKEICSEFYFAYTVNEKNQLNRIFWSDPIARRNYAAFGQVVSFDTTYGTNRYCMVFAPFTGLDNHKRSVTFGCGLLMKEDIESYTWLFEQFKKAMCSEPIILITDQDCAMKSAFERVFENTRHRLCMWHIMDKVSTKVGSAKMNEPNFRKDMGQLVWRDQLTPEEFEEGWETFTIKHNVHDNPWLKDMYQIRSYWIPAYFRDIVLGGLIRTTSISESQNSFFGKYSNKNFTLVELMMHFESALSKQRHGQLRNDVESDTRAFELQTPLAIEKHASNVYTLSIFAQIQKEINDACFYCCVINESKGDDYIDYTIRENQCDFYEVRYNTHDGHTTCSCMVFNQSGLPCCHMFTALKANGCTKVPDSMIHPRWKKGASRTIGESELKVVMQQSARMEHIENKRSEMWSAIYACVGLLEDDESKIDIVLEYLKMLKTKLDPKSANEGHMNTSRVDLEDFVGISVPGQVDVLTPGKARNKGCGNGGRPKGGRIEGGKEKSIKSQNKVANKGKRKCRKCGQYKGHDSRNCTEV